MHFLMSFSWLYFKIFLYFEVSTVYFSFVQFVKICGEKCCRFLKILLLGSIIVLKDECYNFQVFYKPLKIDPNNNWKEGILGYWLTHSPLLVWVSVLDIVLICVRGP